MIGFYSVALGIITVIIAVFLIRREFGNSFITNYRKYEALPDDQSKELFKRLDKIEREVDLLNESVYDLLADLEGKYSVLAKEDELKDDKIEQLSSKVDELQRRFEKGETAVTAEINRLSKTVNTSLTSVEKLKASAIQADNHDKEEYIAAEEKPNPAENNDTDEIGIRMDDEALRGKIIEMRHRGYSLSRIAKDLDIGIGELQLILNLNK